MYAGGPGDAAPRTHVRHTISTKITRTNWPSAARRRGRRQDRAALLERVRQIAGIRKLDQLPLPQVEKGETVQRSGYRIEKLELRPEEGIVLPALLFVPEKAAGRSGRPLRSRGRKRGRRVSTAAASSNSSSAAPACWRSTFAARARRNRPTQTKWATDRPRLAGRHRCLLPRPVVRRDACGGRFDCGPLCREQLTAARSPRWT